MNDPVYCHTLTVILRLLL